jgi:glutamate N-acetyltransferase/amino-acid N-acetyltransferase
MKRSEGSSRTTMLETAYQTIQECEGGVTGPSGFMAAGIHCGIKKGKKDLALIVSEIPAHAAAVFTTNIVAAAPVLVDREQLNGSGSGTVSAIVVNSGNANACTGERGMQDAWRMVEATAAALGAHRSQILVSSTGVIGQYLPMEKVLKGISAATGRLSASGNMDAAEAIMTTDTFPKELGVSIEIGGTTVTIGGIAKGSGMIAPNMATMLGFVTTDAAIDPAVLRTALKQATDRSFNRITVDGDTSTNDMVVVLANGAAGNRPLMTTNEPDYQLFYQALEHLLVRLAKMIVVDGEGATKLVEVCVAGAETEAEAAMAAKSVANSSLVKTAIHGEDANWGRILAAVGYSGISFDPAAVEIFFDDVPILRQHYDIDFSEEDAKRVLSGKEFTVTIDLHKGPASASFWTCDLSKEYISINAHYRT